MCSHKNSDSMSVAINTMFYKICFGNKCYMEDYRDPERMTINEISGTAGKVTLNFTATSQSVCLIPILETHPFFMNIV